MNPETRDRAVLPVVMPVLIILGMLAYALSVSRVFLAIPEWAATLTGLLIAVVILAASFALTRGVEPSGKAMGGLLAVVMAVVIAAGVAAHLAGPREITPIEPEGQAAASDHAAPAEAAAPADGGPLADVEALADAAGAQRPGVR